MEYFKRIIYHYITLAFIRLGDSLPSDCHAELNGAFDALEQHIEDTINKRIQEHADRAMFAAIRRARQRSGVGFWL